MNKRKSPASDTSVALSPAQRIGLRVTLFLTGASIMVLEILGTRIIGPHFGVGLFVWTSLITVAMVALALGYWLGGRFADRRPSLLHLAAILMVAALLVAVIPLIREPVLHGAWGLGLRTGSMVTSSALLFLPLFLLGMVTPFAVRLETVHVAVAGSSAGRLYAISTTGSVFGTVLAGFLLVPGFRVPTVLAMVAATLVFGALLCAGSAGLRRLSAAALMILALAVFLALPGQRPAALVASGSCDGTDVRVVAHGENRYLFVDQALQTSVNAEGRALEKYTYFLASRLLLARPDTRNAALIGLGGGGIVPMLANHGVEMECVDLSPRIIEFARAHFGFDLPADKVHVMDGRVFLKQRPKRYDAVILDVFTGDRLAYSLCSVEGLRTAKETLTPGGILAMNTWGIDEEKAAPSRVGAAIRATLQEVFTHVLAVPAAGNLLFFASDAPILSQRSSVMLQTFDIPRHFTWLEVPPTAWPPAPVLTDDWNPVDTLDAKLLEQLRVARRNEFPSDVRAALDWE
jgi:spermidine synthase